MVKRGLFFFYIFLIISFSQCIYAGSLGMSPSYFSFNFEPGLEKEIKIQIACSDLSQPISIYLEGDLNEYVNLSKEEFVGIGELIVKIKLPEKIEKPGKHRIIIGSRENKKEEDPNSILGVSAIQVPIDIFVPYPGKYAEANLNISNANEDENVSYTITISNLGKETINFTYDLEIFSDQKEQIFKIKDKNFLEINQKMTIKEELDSKLFIPGNYYADLKINYEENQILLKENFIIGTFFIDISNYTHQFISNKINPFLIQLDSYWNSEIENVYVEISVSENGTIKTYFKTPTESFKPLETKQILGYLDGEKISPGKYLGNIKISYAGKEYGKLVSFYFNKQEKTKNEKMLQIAMIIITILLLAILFLGTIIYQMEKRKKGKK